MVAKIVKLSILMLLLSITSSYAQTSDSQKKELEKYEQKSYAEYKERVQTFISLLDVDDFKAEIIKQKIDEFYKKRQEILVSQISEYEKEPIIGELKTTHFDDVQELYTPETILSIQRFMTDNKAEIKKLQKTKKNN